MKKTKAKRILVVDDDLLARKYIEVLLKDKYEVMTAKDATEAGNLMGEKFPDLIILDIIMPEINGLDFLKLMNKSLVNVPVIYVSGKPEYYKKAHDLGAVSFLTKPIKPATLLKAVAAVLER